jgi:hypothetical protein
MIEGLDDFHFHVAHHAGFGDLHPVCAEVFGDVAKVGVLGAARQDLVADDQDGAGDAIGTGQHA